MFTPLGIKTDYSLLKSLIKIDDYIAYANNYNLKTLGILDNNLCSSHVFYEKCKNNGIKPIIGLDLKIENYEIYLYPKNYEGLTNLFKLTKLDVLEIKTLKDYKEAIICVIPYSSRDLYELLNQIFDTVFIAFSNSEEEKNAKIITDNIIYINETLTLNSNTSKYINYLRLIDEAKKLGDIQLVDYSNKVIKLLDYDTSRLTDLIDIKFPENKKYIPKFDEKIDSVEYLKTLSSKGLSKRLNGKVSKIYQERLNYELDVITKMGFTDYFLIVFDYVRFAIKNNIFVGVGRGSAAGSLVAYSLGITWIDPIKYNLLFERFLNPERVTMPDIDIDFEDVRREEVVDYVRETYGENRVGKIIAFGTMTAKEVLRVVGKINNIDDGTMNSLMKYIDSKKSLKDNLTTEVKNILGRNSLLKKVYEEAYPLEGLKKHVSTHAAGVVISSVDLTDVVPLVKSGDEFIIGYDKDELEVLGILKMDFLSIKNLTIMSDALKEIKSNTGKSLDINNIPLNDKEVYDLFSRADTAGVFQFESSGLKNLLLKVKPNCFEDLVMCIAIFRPGPMEFIPEYIDMRKGIKKVKYIDESLKPILESTYGILVYQEQIMEILRKMGNFSYAEADIIRRAISKKKLSAIESAKERFIENSINNGYSEEVSNTVYNWICKFAEFGFNRSHSVAYAYIAYQMAYLKVHYKDFYYINLLNSNINGEAKTKEYIDEAKKNGISILKPDINNSYNSYVKESDGIRIPLRVIKNIGSSISDAIIKVRGNEYFKDFFDFVARTYGTNINKKAIESLILAGVLDGFKYNRATLIKNIPSSLTYAELIHDLDASLVNKPEMVIVSEYPEYELMKSELELFGFYVSTHPASKYTDCMKQIDIKDNYNRQVTTYVLIENLKVIKTKNGKNMVFLTGSDETTSTEFIIFDSAMSKINEINVGDLVKIVGRVERRFDKYQIVVQKYEKV